MHSYIHNIYIYIYICIYVKINICVCIYKYDNMLYLVNDIFIYVMLNIFTAARPVGGASYNCDMIENIG